MVKEMETTIWGLGCPLIRRPNIDPKVPIVLTVETPQEGPLIFEAPNVSPSGRNMCEANLL